MATSWWPPYGGRVRPRLARLSLRRTSPVTLTTTVALEREMADELGRWERLKIRLTAIGDAPADQREDLTRALARYLKEADPEAADLIGR